jgi:5S rRNA maturation endonuclease (ribonuclease M5)
VGATVSLTAAGIAHQLRGKKNSSGWSCLCPVHEGDGRPHNPSLSITERGGKILVKCHAGCDQGAVVEELKSRGLWPEQERERELSFDERIQCAYDYRDERGEVLYQIVRLRSPKDFRQRYHNGRAWIWKKHPRQVLYGLAEVLANSIIFVVEGEKDANTLRDWGLVGTTNAGGANAPWLDSYTDALEGREVIIIPDNDAPGWARANTISRALQGRAASLTIWSPDGAKDISEWFEQGHSEVELIARIEEAGRG